MEELGPDPLSRTADRKLGAGMKKLGPGFRGSPFSCGLSLCAGTFATAAGAVLDDLGSGLVVSCQDEKSQHKNKAKAMKVLRSRLMEAEQQRADAERASERRSQVGTGERSEKIRTYNFPQTRVTDHRAGVTLHKLGSILEGELDELLDEVTRVMTARAKEDAAKADGEGA